jgi:NitT/TauT family transport system substrate-binding protein
VKNHKRSLSLAAAGIALLALLASASFLLPRHGPKEPTGPPGKLTVAISTALNPALVKIAEAKGFFREEGLDITLQPHTFGKLAIESLLAGKADLATATETAIMFATMRGARFSILATIQTSTKNDAIIARKDRGIVSAADLKGRRIGLTLGTSVDYYLDAQLVMESMGRMDVEIVDLKPEEMADALLQGEVDAVSTFSPFVTNIHKALGDRGIKLQNENI